MENTSKFLMLMFTQYSLYLIYALLSQIQLCRNSALFGEALLAKIWWGEAQKHFKGPGLELLSKHICSIAMKVFWIVFIL